MPMAALPFIAMAAGGVASGIGSAMGSQPSVQTGTIPLPPPAPLFPGMTGQYNDTLSALLPLFKSAMTSSATGGVPDVYAGLANYFQTGAGANMQFGGPNGIAQGTLGEMINTGMPTDIGPAFTAFQQASQRTQAQGAANLQEQFGAAGTRFSTPMAQALTDYNSQATRDFMSTYAQWQQQAREAARGRQMQGLSLAGGLQTSTDANRLALLQQAIQTMTNTGTTGMTMFSGPAMSFYNTAQPYAFSGQSGNMAAGIGQGLSGIGQSALLFQLLKLMQQGQP